MISRIPDNVTVYESDMMDEVFSSSTVMDCQNGRKKYRGRGLSDIVSFTDSNNSFTLTSTDRSSRASIYSRRATLSCLGIARPDSISVEEKRRRIQTLLNSIYDDDNHSNKMTQLYPYRGDTASITDTTLTFSDHSTSFQRQKHTFNQLRNMSIDELKEAVDSLYVELEYANTKLVRAVKQKSTQLNRVMNKCCLVTAVLQAMSEKRSSDSKLRFSLDPPRTENGFEGWKQAMKAVAKLPGGVPGHFRKKLWITLAEEHIASLGISWETICKTVFSETVLPEDEQLNSQIIKDLHRTGWEGFSDVEEQLQLRRVLLGYARYNKDVGYCQGFNVIAALILQVVDYKADKALMILFFLLEQVLPCGYFDQSLRALSVDMIVLRDLLHQRLPSTIEHMEKLQKMSENQYEPPLLNVFSMNWLLTLYATCLPSSTVYRLWDAVMLEGSEVLLRTSLAIWAKLSRKIAKTRNADEFYSLMETLCKQLQEMKKADEDNLITVIYSMSEFPYPGLAELRDKYTWNIQPLSDNFKLFQKSVKVILSDDTSDEDTVSTTCSPRRKKDEPKKELQLLQKQYQLMRQRQKQASLILKTAYDHGQRAMSCAKSKCVVQNPLFRNESQTTVFNHLYMGHQMASQEGVEPPTTISGGALALSPTIVQPTGPTDLKSMKRQIGHSSAPMCILDKRSQENEKVNKNNTRSAATSTPSTFTQQAPTTSSGRLTTPQKPELRDSGRESTASSPSREEGNGESRPSSSSSSVSFDDENEVNRKLSGELDRKARMPQNRQKISPQSSKKRAMLRKSKAMLDSLGTERNEAKSMHNPFRRN